MESKTTKTGLKKERAKLPKIGSREWMMQRDPRLGDTVVLRSTEYTKDKGIDGAVGTIIGNDPVGGSSSVFNVQLHGKTFKFPKGLHKSHFQVTKRAK